MSSSLSNLMATLTLQEESSERYSLTAKNFVIIGRSPECEIALNPEKYISVSRHHAKLEMIDDKGQIAWQVSDLGTTNGTLVNDQKITESYSLKSGDRITLGLKGPEFLFESHVLNPTVLVSVPAEIPAPSVIKTVEEPVEPVESPVVIVSEKEEKVEPSSEAIVVKEETSVPSSTPISVAQSDPHIPMGKTVWNVLTLKEINRIADIGEGVSFLTLSPDGKILATTGSNKLIKLWNLETKEEIFELSGHKLAVNALAFSPDGKILATTGSDKLIKLWNLETKEEICELGSHKLAVNAVAFSPDGKILATAGSDKLIKLWDLETKEEICELSGHKLAINAVVFNSDGQVLATSGSDKLIKLWDFGTKQEILSINTKHLLPIHSLIFSQDSQRLISAGEDKSVRLFEVATGEEVLSFNLPVEMLKRLFVNPLGDLLIGLDVPSVIIWTLV
jgi:WD40 repeat protein